jgi:RecA-family ATPase
VIASWQILDAATATRKRLLRAGFVPIPTEGKRPPVPGWQNLAATEADIDGWFHQYDSALNTGVLTRTTPAVDSDVDDPDVAEEIEALLWEIIGTRGMVRFGQPPKRAALFRTETPFAKIATPVFASPTQQRHRVEVLCDGQQVVVLGTHPGTGKPYSWHGGEPGDVARADLPELTQKVAGEFIARAAAIMRARGWTEEPRKSNGAHHGGDTGDEFDAIYGGRERKYALAALQGCADELASMAPDSGRNDKLNALAFRLGTMSARGWISRDEVTDRLFQAAAACRLVADDGETATRATLESGLRNGELTPHPDLAEETQPQGDKADAPVILEPLPFIDMSAWRIDQAPPRDWSVRELIPRRNLFLLSGDGAAGKTLLALQLGIAHALGRDWIGTLPEPGPFLYFGAEDEPNELYCRLADILKHYHADFPDLQDQVQLLSYAGEDAVLGSVNRAGIVTPTLLYERLLKAAAEMKPAMICIDTAADTFVGNEIDRSQVRQFIGLLRRLAIQANGHVFLNSHVSLTGISSGSGLSGSTAWHNSVRARGYLTSVKTDKDEEPDPTLRRLEFKKNNYGPIARSIDLRWERGVYVPVGGIGSVDKMAKEQTADQLFTALLDRFNGQGRNVSEKATAKNYAPTVFGKEAEAKKYGLRKADFEAAMRRLFDASQIAVEPYGPPCRGTTRLVTK